MTTAHTMRTHPLVQDTNCTNTVNLGITTRCSMRCPDCSIDINGIRERGEAKDASLADIAVWLGTLTNRGPLKRVHVTGGEPTLHDRFPQVMRVVKAFRDAGLVGAVSVETNGFRYAQHAGVFHTIDLVFCTHYQAGAVYPGSPDNTALIDLMQRTLKDRLVREAPVRHLPGHVSPGIVQLGLTTAGQVRQEEQAEARACSKWYDPGLPAGVYDGRVYKCCVGVGMGKHLGVPITPDWRDLLTVMPKGCVRCAFRGT